MKFGFSSEPLVWSGFAAAIMITLVEFGIDVTQGQQTAIQGLVAAAFLLFARSQVTPTSKIDDPPPMKIRPTYGPPPSVGAVLLVAALSGGMLAGCATRDGVQAAPDVVALDVGSDVLNLTADLQRVVNEYARQRGTNAATDAVRNAIADRVLPAARQLRATVVSYHAINDAVTRQSKIADVEASIRAVVEAYAAVSGREDVGELSAQINETAARVNALVAQLRLELARARGGA